MALSRKIRVIVAKPGLDGHDRGAKVIARALRDAGMEVIYTGLHLSADQIAAACLDEDVHVCCLSVLSGAHRTLVPEVIKKLGERGMDHVAVLAGGIIPDADKDELIAAGCKAVAGPGTSMSEIVEMVTKYAEKAEAKSTRA